MKINPRSYEMNKVIRKIIILISNIISTTYFRSFRINSSPSTIGFNNYTIPTQNTAITGYFQSYKWLDAPTVKLAIKNLKIKSEGKQIKNYIDLAKIESPAIVHIRLGDYKDLKNFGVLNNDYYEVAIKRLLQKINTSHLWIFSDEVALAKTFIDLSYVSQSIRWIQSIDNSSASTLELMRYGAGYVIGNSTFSWWGAYLAYSQNVPVFAPTPWFANGSTPADLIPPHWQLIQAH
jgi:hypothetical protein